MERLSTTATVRTFQPGDDVAQVSIYNEAAAALPRFKPATLDEVRRRLRDPEFDPATRLYALENGRPVAYTVWSPSGRVSHPWCRKGREELAVPLFDHALEALRQRGVSRAFAAYRADWEPIRDFFTAHGFSLAREMINFVMDLVEMPTPAARAGSPITPLTPADLPEVLRLGKGILRTQDVESLRRHLFDNLYFPPSSVFALRQKADGPPMAVGVLVTSAAFADPTTLDANMPCFRLGAFGTEGLTHKRINGLFSVLAQDDRDLLPITLDLLSYANRKLEDTEVGAFAAQVPSDAPHLVRFYKSLFRRHGAFPVYERAL
jgi:hypothetical protein